MREIRGSASRGPDFRAFVRGQLTALDLPAERESKIVEELAAQLEDSYEALVASGRPEAEAWEVAQRQIPDWQALGAELLDAESTLVRRRAARSDRDTRNRWFSGVAGDLRSSVRSLRRSRGFAAATLLTLAVCLGANAAIFTVVDSVLLRPLPVHDADRIVALGDVYPFTPNDILSNDVPSYFDRRAGVPALAEQAMFAPWFDTLTIEGVSVELRGMRATPSLFRLLQVQPIVGRTFDDAEGEVGAERKILLSHGLWQRLYGGDRSAVGKDLRLGWTGQPYTIVGVLPPGFSFFDRGADGHAKGPGDTAQFWIPLAFSEAQKSDAARTRYGFHHVGRLRPGATIEQVQAQVDAVNSANFERFPEFEWEELGMRTAVTPLREALTRGVRKILYLLWGGAAFLLLIGALNIANLSLARASVRARELATRLALGANRFQITRQLVAEGLLLALAGGAAGLTVAHGILRTLVYSGTANLPNGASVSMDWTVIGLTLAVSVAVGVATGLVPATTTGRIDLGAVLAEGSRLGTGGRAAGLFRRGLVVAQVAVSVVLLIGAGLLSTSFRNLLTTDAGFDGEGVATATIFPPPSRYPDASAVVGLTDRLVESARAIPGVVSAGITSNIALSGQTTPSTVFPAERPPQEGEAPLLPSVVSVTPGYFETLGTSLLRGRYFAASDRADSLLVAIVDEGLAKRLWPGEDPIGKRLQRGDSKPYTVVGVVRDVRFEGLAAPSETVGTAYFPHTQSPPVGRLRWIAVKTSGESTPVIRGLRAALAEIDPDLPLSDIQSMRQRASGSVVPQKLAMGLASGFGIVALLLSALGVYGVLAYVVAQRSREIGIRIALGSNAQAVFQLVFRDGLILVGGGLAVGLAGSLVLGRVFEGQLFGVGPNDPWILGAVVTATALVALAACVSPGRRATRVDPLRVLSDS